MSYITAYGAVVEPRAGRLPVEECIESLYDHVDEFLIVDASKYDKLDLSKYGKVKKHIRTVFPPFDNPFGSLYTLAYNLVDSDTCLFLDLDEIFEFKTKSLQDLLKQYPLHPGVGIAFNLRNYYGSRYFSFAGNSSKGMHVFSKMKNLGHDLLAGFWGQRSLIRRTNNAPDKNDGVRLCDEAGRPTAHYPPVPIEEVTVHHTSFLDPAGKMVRNLIQYNHVATIDFPGFCPFDMRVRPELVEKIYKLQQEEAKNGDLELYTEPVSFDYDAEPCELLDRFIERCNIMEFDPTKQKDYAKYLKEETSDK